MPHNSSGWGWGVGVYIDRCISIDFAKYRMQVYHIMPLQYSNKLHGRVIIHYDCTQSSFRFWYRLLTMTISFEIAV